MADAGYGRKSRHLQAPGSRHSQWRYYCVSSRRAHRAEARLSALRQARPPLGAVGSAFCASRSCGANQIRGIVATATCVTRAVPPAANLFFDRTRPRTCVMPTSRARRPRDDRAANVKAHVIRMNSGHLSVLTADVLLNRNGPKKTPFLA
jgi:hypothetical protein